MNGERHFKGKVSFALAHTHRLVTKTQNHSPYLLIGVFFLISVAYNVNKQRKPLCVAVTAQSISGTSKILKTTPSRTVILIEK